MATALTSTVTLLQEKFMFHLVSACLLLSLCLAAPLLAEDKPRLIVLTDIGGDPDDSQAIVRLLVYANAFEIEALIASASGIPGELGQAITRPDLIRNAVNAYGSVRSNLVQHDPGYPTAQFLLDRITSGNPNRGTSFIGSGRDTAGSNAIIAVVDRSDPRPVNISIWGGQTDLAQALWKVKATRSTSAYNMFTAKIRVHDIADQDGIYAHIRSNHPGLWYILSNAPIGADKREGAFRGMYLGGDESLTSLSWITNHVITNHGPLGALYPNSTWTDPNPYGALKEGDTPSWFYFLDQGLSVAGQPGYGSWGGRFQVDSGTWFKDAKDTVGGSTLARATVYRWRPAFQNHFQARMDWCVKPYAQANHAPVVTLNGAGGTGIVHISAHPGQTVSLSAAGSTDPDGNVLGYTWWQYREAGTHTGTVAISGSTSNAASFIAPSVSEPRTIHIILEVTDNGSPALTSYRRAIVQVSPGSTNQAPSAALTSPSAGANFTAPASITVSANASDGDGSVAKVEFFAGSLKIGEDSSAPYGIVWSNVAAGSYTLTARATDNQGASGTSAAVAIDVTAPSAFPTALQVASGRAYQWTTLRVGASLYIDRTFTVTGVPAALQDQILLRSANDDKFSAASNTGFITFSLAKEARVYVAYTAVNTTLASTWCTTANGWQDEHITLATSLPGAESHRLVRSKLFPAGTVQLGGNGATSGTSSMYHVVVAPTGVQEALTSNLVVASGRPAEWFDLSVGDALYTDRSFGFASVPEGFLDQLTLRPANDDKFSAASNTAFITFTLAQEARVYVVYTTVNTSLATTWCTAANGWQSESSTIGTTLPGAEAVRQIRSKIFPPGQVALGGNGATSGTSSMYHVIVIPTTPVGNG